MTDQTQVQDTDTDDVQDTSTDQTTTEQDSQPTGFDALPKETQDEIKALRRENAKHRKALKDYEDSQKTELERYQSAAEEYKSKYEALEAKYRDSAAESAFLDAATKANARAPKTLFRAYKSDLEFDDDGNVTNLSAVIDKARKDEPELFRAAAGSGDGGKRGDTHTNDNDLNALFRKYAGKQ